MTIPYILAMIPAILVVSWLLFLWIDGLRNDVEGAWAILLMISLVAGMAALVGITYLFLWGLFGLADA